MKSRVKLAIEQAWSNGGLPGLSFRCLHPSNQPYYTEQERNYSFRAQRHTVVFDRRIEEKMKARPTWTGTRSKNRRRR